MVNKVALFPAIKPPLTTGRESNQKRSTLLGRERHTPNDGQLNIKSSSDHPLIPSAISR